MIKKHRSRFCFIKRYRSDFFGDIARKGFKKKWSEDTQTFKIYFKNIKVIEKFIKEKWVNIMERKLLRRANRGKNRKSSEFFYRVDIIKLKPKRKRRTFFGMRLFKRQRMRFFASQITAKKYRFYLRKAGQSMSMLKRFFELFESRFDVFLYKLNFIQNGFSGHQLINHKNFMVNDKIVIFPSQQIKLYDVISPVDKGKFFFIFLKRLLKIRKKFLKKFKFTKFLYLERNPTKRFRYLFRTKINHLYINDFFLKFPKYIEINYRLMAAMFIKKPLYNEVEFPFKVRKNLRRLRYTKKFLKRRKGHVKKRHPAKKRLLRLNSKFRDKTRTTSKLKIPTLSHHF